MKHTLFSTNIKPSAKMHAWLFFLRVSAGTFMLTHGLPKLLRMIEGNYEFADPFGIGEGPSLILTVFAEAVCSVFLIIGLGTRIASFFLSITMIVAAFMIHADDPFSKKEMGLLYLLIFMTLLVFGGGRFSVDHKIAGQTRRR